MRVCRFGDDRLGLVRGELVHDVTAALGELGPYSYPLPRHDPMVAALPELMPLMERLADEAEGRPWRELDLLSPVANPGKIIAAPVNYLKHLEEARGDEEINFKNQVEVIGRVGCFLKATSSMIGAAGPVSIRFPDRRNDHELELVAVIGRTADRVTAADALDHVAAYTVGLDMTVRGPEERSMRKSIDTYSVLGPWMVSADEFGDPSNVDIELTVNGEVRQRANTRDLIFSVAELIEWVSSYYTLHPGDVLFTGTPDGVGPVKGGDVIRATIEKIGTLTVAVEQAA